MSIDMREAKPDDVEQLLALYYLIYGTTYPFKLCTDRSEMAQAIGSDDYLWLVVEDSKEEKIVSSAIFEIDRENKIGKLGGVVVDPEARKHGLAFRMIDRGSRVLLASDGPLNSIYATTRTVSVGPQLMCMKAGFKAMGIFPNSHRLTNFETTTLLVKFREGLLEKRAKKFEILKPLVPILKIANQSIDQDAKIDSVEVDHIEPKGEILDFEIIDEAPKYVYRTFTERFSGQYDRFFPFHKPNVLAVSQSGEVEIFANLNKSDGYCAIVALTQPLYTLKDRMDSLLNRLHDIGISYVEVLIGLPHKESIQVLLDKQFLPSAIYPAMQEVDGEMHDFVIMSRSMEPLNFKGMAIEMQFKPFIDQYVDLWKKAHLDSLEVFNDYS